MIKKFFSFHFISRIMDKPWVDKYRPKELKGLVQQERAVGILKRLMTSENMPHLLFYGPPGVGKTTAILALCRELYKTEYSTRVLELNASDDRGIDVIRSKIKDFARQVCQEKTLKIDGNDYKIPSYKFLILDEADNMTPDAQGALRRTMEVYAGTMRVCLICNYVSRLIAPIVSRCCQIRFESCSGEDCVGMLKRIVNKEITEEEYRPNEETMRRIIELSGGDMRRSITLLQSAALLDEPITRKNIDSLCGVVLNDDIEYVLNKIIEIAKKMRNNQSVMDDIWNLSNNVIKKALGVSDLLQGILEKIMNGKEIMREEISSHNVNIIAAQLAVRYMRAERMIMDGSSDLIVLCDALNFTAFSIRKFLL